MLTYALNLIEPSTFVSLGQKPRRLCTEFENIVFAKRQFIPVAIIQSADISPGRSKNKVTSN